MEITLIGFCTKDGEIGGNDNTPILTVFPCSYRINRNNDEIDIYIRSNITPFISETVHYIGDPYPELAKRIQSNFWELYELIPSEQDIYKLLKAVNFIC